MQLRLLQIAVSTAALVPIYAGGTGVVRGVEMVEQTGGAPTDLDSHFRYLSGLLLGIGFAFLATVPQLGRRHLLFITLALIVIAGGLARLLSLFLAGRPSGGHILGLMMELGVVPLLLVWHLRLSSHLARVR